MKRLPIALLAALVAGMALVAAGVVGDRFGFHDWPMSPAPQMAQHVNVEHPRLSTPEPMSSIHETSPATVAAESADQTLPADSARGATRLVGDHTQRAVRHPAHHEHGGTSTPAVDGEVSGGDGTADPAPTTSTQTSTPTPTPTPPAPAPTTSGNEVTAASTDTPTPARAQEETPPVDPQPAPQPDPTPAPPADPTPTPTPPTSGGGEGQGNGHSGRHHGPIRQLLHDLLGLGNVQG
jgi:hypothetical protein